MGLGRALQQGVVEASRRLKITVTLYLANLMAAALVAAPMAILLDRAIGRSVAAQRLDAVFRLDVLLDLLRSQSSAFAEQFQLLGVGALAYALMGSFLTGGVIDTLRSPVRSPFLPRFFGGCGRFALRYLRLLPYLAMVLFSLALLSRGLDRLLFYSFDQSAHEIAAFWAMRAKQGVMLILLLLTTATFDLARILTAVEDRRHMSGALLTASGFVARHVLSILGLYALLLGLSLSVFVPYLAAAQGLLPPAAIVPLVIAQQAVMLVRHWARVVGFGSILAFYRGATGAAPERAGDRTEAIEPVTGPGASAFSVPSGPFILVLLLALQAAHQVDAAPLHPAETPAGAPTRSRRIVDYQIEARLDPETHEVSGRETLLYRNDTRATMTDVRLHLYPNAFSNDRTLYMRGGAWDDRTFAALLQRMKEDGAWGQMTVASVHGPGGTDLTAKTTVDESIMTVPLPVPVPPGASVRLEIAWTTLLPRTFHRMGYWGEHHDIAQWFPKAGVFTDAGWKVHPLQRRTEFFADFGTYLVTLTVPERFTLDATGVPIDTRHNPDGSRSVTYRAEDVHDFAWIADPDLVFARQVVAEGPYAAAPVEIVYAHHPYRATMVPRILAAVRTGLLYYGERFMPYPYPRLVVDDLPMGLGGGMEYPMLFTVSMAWYLPSFYAAPEEVTLHEFGHQYWYGIVATNEVEEAWLDEGIDSFVTRHAMQALFGAPRKGRTANALFAYAAARAIDEGIDLPLGDRRVNLDQLLGFRDSPFQPSGGGLLGSKIDPLQLRLPGLDDALLQWSRQGYAAVAHDDPMAAPSWAFHPGSYSAIVYDKTDVVLETLDRMLGAGSVEEGLRIYLERHRFTHPTRGDFFAAMEETAARRRPGLDLRPVLQQMVEGTGTLDFAVESLRSRPLEAPRGFIPAGHAGEPSLDRRAAQESGVPGETAFETEVIVRRNGEVILPVTLLVRFENGEERRETWDGHATWKRFTYETGSRAVRAEVDPDGLYTLDLDINNNGRTLDRQPRPVARLSSLWLFWLQNYLHMVASLI